MGYRGGELVDLAGPLDAGVRRFGRRATERVGERLHRQVRRHTPVAKPGTPELVASYSNSGAWIKSRGGRRPGTLKNSWEQGPVRTRGRSGTTMLRFSVEVETHDPVARHVEYPTRPHTIRPKRAKALTVPTRSGMSFRGEVHHPGTQGSYMMTKALADIDATWEGLVAAEWSVEARRLWQGDAS